MLALPCHYYIKYVHVKKLDQVSHLNNDFLWEGPGKMSDHDEDVLSDASKSDLDKFLSKVDEIGR